MALHANHYNAVRAIGSGQLGQSITSLGKEASATLNITGCTEMAEVVEVLRETKDECLFEQSCYCSDFEYVQGVVHCSLGYGVTFDFKFALKQRKRLTYPPMNKNGWTNSNYSGSELDSLRDLEELDIGGNKIDKFVVSKGLSKLKSLSLSGTGFKGTFDVREFDSFNNLELLDMSFNEINNLVVPQGYNGLRKLKSLDLSGVGVRDGSKLLQSIGSFSSLNSLYLSSNNFTETVTITTQELHNFTNMEYLKLDDSPLHISLLQSIASIFPLLKNLSMIGCEVNGVIRGQDFPHSKSLEHLDMEFMRIALNTSFLQIISESMSSLKYLSLSYYTLGINSSETLNQGLCSLVHLQELYIASNDLRGSLPWCMANMTSLRILDVSSNQLTGSISSSPLVHLTSIEELRLRFLDVSNNNFQGHIPVEIGDILPSLFSFNISTNALHGSIPSSFGNMNFLRILDLSSNQLTGEIPERLAVGCVNLEFLALSNNNLKGHMFCRNFNLANLRQLQLEDNRFIGEIPQSLSKCSSLEGLYLNNNSLSDLSYNHLNGSIPDWFDGLSQLNHLILGHNNLEGEVPVQLCGLNQLQLLDLSNNNLHGPVPHCFDNTTLRESYNNSSSLKPFETSFYGWLTKEQKILESFEFTTKNIEHIYQGKVLSLVAGLDLSCNKLIGHIPPQIGNLTGIQTLNLSHNSLIGSIPSTFSNLEQIESLDISYNKLIGKIPHQLVELKALAVFSVAYNNLLDEIPKWKAQFATFNESSYEGNTFLCGFPLPICKSPATMSEASTSNEGDDNLIDIDSFFITFTPSYVIVIFAIIVVLYVNPYWRRRWFYLIEMWISSCYYSVVDNLIPRRFCH
ncbi:Receptor-like protein 13 [Citrus sinensis]|nr:Receptor-like protein 13 [Citrus sinensis]